MKNFICCLVLLSLAATAALGATGTGDRPDGRDIYSRVPDGKGYVPAPPAPRTNGEPVVWVDDDFDGSTTGWGVDHFATINDGILGVSDGGTVNVYPGAYVEAAVGSYLYDGSGPYTFGLFLAADGVTVQGVDAMGTPITSHAAVLATVQCNSTSNFGPSGVFVEGNGVTISGLEIFLDPNGAQNKTIEVIGDDCTVQYCRLTDGNSLYINDFRFDAGTNTSWVQGYSVIGNSFTQGTSLDLASGAGFSGPVSGRQVLGNSFEMAGWYWPAISFNGYDSGVPWYIYGVGGAVIQGNTFTGASTQYIRARATYDNSQFDWASYYDDNTFDRAVATGPAAPADLREYSYTSGSYVFDHCRRIGAVAQEGIDIAAAGDMILMGAGTYEEQLHITKDDLVITGAGVGSTFVRSPASLPLSYMTGTTPNKPVVFVDGCTGLQMSGLTVDGYGRGNLNYRFQGVGFWNAGGSLSNAAVLNVTDTPFSGAQHGVGIYAYNSTGGPYTVTLSEVFVTGFQKNGTALSGTGLTVSLDDVDVVGAGPTPVTAQNGIQVSYGAGGTITDCAISGIEYTGTQDATASGLLLYGGTNVSATGVTLTQAQSSVYCIDTNGVFSSLTVTSPKGDALYAYSFGAKADLPARRAAQPMDADLPVGGDKSPVNVLVQNSTFIGAGVADSWGPSAYGPGPVTFTVNNCEVANWDKGIVVSGSSGGTFDATVSSCNIHDNVSYGLYTTAAQTVQAACNWWGDVDGPDVAGNPSLGDAVSSGATYAPWLDGIGGSCTLSDNNVSVADAPACVTSASTCVTLPVTFNRNHVSFARGVSVTIQLSPELELCTGNPQTSITMVTGAGSWSDPFTNLIHQIVDNGGGSYTIDRAILGTPCGPDHGGILFNVNVKPSAAVTTEAIGTVTVTAVDVRDCANAVLPGIPGAAGEVAINLTTPAALTGLTAAQRKTGNDSDGTTKINLSWAAPTGDADFITIWRKGYGDYPEYNDGAGAVPAAPVDAGHGWTLVTTLPATSTACTDEPPVRDFWYYAAYVSDECGNTSPVSAITGGTLNYHLGDFSDGTTVGAGNNLVFGEDISALGSHYGVTLTPYGDTRNYLDVGPTTDYSVDARPTTDNRVQFEDLMVFAMNYEQVSKIELPTIPAAANTIEVVSGPTGSVGSTFDVAVVLGANGKLQGLSVALAWDAAVVEPVGMEPGDLLAAYGGQALVLSPEPGTVDAALMGVRDKAIAGQGVLATVTFRVKAAGNAAVTLGNVVARDRDNRPLSMTGGADLPPVSLPSVSELRANVPNPFNPSTEFSFVLAVEGPVSLRVYSVRGELVRTLVDQDLPAGPHSLTWNGLNDQGRQVASGAYIVRFIAPDRTQSRHVTLLK